MSTPPADPSDGAGSARLTEEQAVDLLVQIVGSGGTGMEPDAAVDGAADLVAELGFLPLAIKQAAAYLVQNQVSPRQYLGLLASSPDAGDADGHARTIARTWRIALDRLAADTPLTGDLLRILAWFAPGAAPRTMLDGLNELEGWGSATPPLVQAALGELDAYSMVTLTPDAIAVHELVQAVAGTADEHDPHRRAEAITAALRAATRLLNRRCPDEAEDPDGFRRLLPHIEALTSHAAPGTDDTETMLLLANAAGFFLKQGLLARAIPYFERVVNADRRLHGTDNPDSLFFIKHLADAYRSIGDLRRAVPAYEQVLAGRERVLGLDDVSTLTSRNDLAGAYQAIGDLDGAISAYERVLADAERVLGFDHPSTLAARGNLAAAHQVAGNLGWAITLYEQTLADRERVLGVDHPDTLRSRNNLAYACEGAGDLSRAIPIYERTLADAQRVLGVDHPATLTGRSNLAHAYQAAGDPARAIPIYEEVLAVYERDLGTDHPTTRQARRNLEAWRAR